MKINLTLAAALALAASLHTVHAQGSLTPPPGVPGPVMKTLSQIEARTPLVAGQPGVAIDANGSITISQPGSYYLTGNVTITAAGAAGIIVGSDSVSLDLGGFSLTCTTGSGGSAVQINSASSVRVHNGHIVGGTTVSGSVFTFAGWSNGVKVITSKTGLSADGLRITGVRDSGIDLGSRDSRVGNCSVQIAGGNGIFGSHIVNCTVGKSGGSGIVAFALNGFGVVENCTGETVYGFNGEYGISAPQANVINSSGIAVVDYGLLAGNATNCRGKSTSGTGLFVTQNASNCTGDSASGAGLSAETASGCTGLSSSGIGLIAKTASNCIGSSNNGSYGMDISGTASFCRGSRSSGIAIRAGIAIGCTPNAGTISSSQKHLGTP